jgi:hypothetical protein
VVIDRYHTETDTVNYFLRFRKLAIVRCAGIDIVGLQLLLGSEKYALQGVPKLALAPLATSAAASPARPAKSGKSTLPARNPPEKANASSAFIVV